MFDLRRSSAEQHRLNTAIHNKIRRLERPSISSIFNPASLRCLTPSPSHGLTESEAILNEDSIEDDNSTENKDITELDDDELNNESLNESAKAPKIWISKSASMEHDLGWSK